jgi:predicted  nucleic acid-binding Zn-ribbon protein
MGEKLSEESPNLSVLESVRCLDCGEIYAKPARGGTAAANPGCPACGYVGWLSVTIPIGEHDRYRSAADRLRHRSA